MNLREIANKIASTKMQPCSKCDRETYGDAFIRDDKTLCLTCTVDYDYKTLPQKEFLERWVKPDVDQPGSSVPRTGGSNMSNDELLKYLDGCWPRVNKGVVTLIREDETGKEIEVPLPDGSTAYVDDHPEGSDRGGYVPFVEINGIQACYDSSGEWGIVLD